MANARPTLERIRDRFVPPPGGFERLVARREGRLRIRRVSVATVALALSAGLFVGLWSVMRTAAPPSPRPAGTVTVAVGGSPIDVAVGEGSVWVATVTDPSGRGEVIRIDPTEGQVVARIPLPEVGALAVGEGGVWVANLRHGTVTRIDPETHEVADVITMPPLPYEVAEGDDVFLPERTTTSFGRVWVSTARGSVASIDPGTGEASVVTSEPQTILGGVTTGAGSVWAWNTFEPPEAEVWRISPESGEVERVSVPATVLDAAAGSAGLYVLHAETGEVSLVGAVDPVQGPIEGVAQIGSVGERANSIAVLDPTVYVAAASGNIYAIDQGSGDVTRLTPVPGEPTALTVVADAVWVTTAEGTVTEVPLERGAVPEPTVVPTPTTVAPCTPTSSQMKQAETQLGQWLLGLLEGVGAPEGWEITRDQVTEPSEFAGSGFLLRLPQYAGRFDLALFAEPPDVMNVTIEEIPVIARSREWALHASWIQKGFQAFIAASPEAWVTVHVFPAGERIRDRDMVKWFHDLVEEARRNPPPPECVPDA